MQRNISLIKKIREDIYTPSKNILDEYNLYQLFSPLQDVGRSTLENNILVCFIVYAYDNDSEWLNMKQDRTENKWKILKSLGANIEDPFFRYIVTNENYVFNNVISEYLIEQTTWKWQYIMHRLDSYATMIRFATQKTDDTKTVQKIGKGKEEDEVKTAVSEYSELDIAKVHQQKAELFSKALEARKEIDHLLLEIQKDFVQLDDATRKDFGLGITDEKTIDPASWTLFIKSKNDRIKSQQHQ